jgi:hypothetical protein
MPSRAYASWAAMPLLTSHRAADWSSPCSSKRPLNRLLRWAQPGLQGLESSMHPSLLQVRGPHEAAMTAGISLCCCRAPPQQL